MHVRARQDVPALPHLARQYWSLTKPRVTQLAIGSTTKTFTGTAVMRLVDHVLKAPLAQGELSPLQALVFSGLIGGAGMWVLYVHVNPLTMWLTFATFVGYAIVYTIEGELIQRGQVYASADEALEAVGLSE